VDGKYRITNTGLSLGENPEENQIACKSPWESDESFVIEFHIIGDPTKLMIDFSFSGDKVTIKFSPFGFDMNTLTNGTMGK
jgi:hypothetical protein